MTGIEHYPAEAVAVAKSRGYDEQAHIKAIADDRDDDISLTHPTNWLTETEVTDLWDVAFLNPSASAIVSLTGDEVMFVTPYTLGPEGWTDEAFAARQNSPATIVEQYDDFDEVGPMYRIRFSDGVAMTVWPEEIGLGIIRRYGDDPTT